MRGETRNIDERILTAVPFLRSSRAIGYPGVRGGCMDEGRAFRPLCEPRHRSRVDERNSDHILQLSPGVADRRREIDVLKDKQSH